LTRTSRFTHRAEQTRAEILRAAEHRFGMDGFTKARLENIAGDVGVKRAALFYHFRDKQELYRLVLDDLTQDLFARLGRALSSTGSFMDRLEAALITWVDFVGERPAIARIALRESAAPSPAGNPRTVAAPFVDLVEKVFQEGIESGAIHPVSEEPLQLMSAIGGATLFHVAALPNYVPEDRFDPLADLESHKSDLLRIARRLLAPGPHGVHGA